MTRILGLHCTADYPNADDSLAAGAGSGARASAAPLQRRSVQRHSRDQSQLV